MRDAFVAAGDDRWGPKKNHPATAIAHADVAAYVDLLDRWSRGIDVPAGWVPTSEFWIVDDGEVVGELGLRHHLNDWLQQVGGHIGYDVHPERRNRGIATFALREALKIAAEMRIHQVLLTCLDDNAASIRVIEKCGGTRIEDARYDGPKRRRYLMTTRAR